jgi:DNA-binding transcriptional LysR family regulator
MTSSKTASTSQFARVNSKPIRISRYGAWPKRGESWRHVTPKTLEDLKQHPLLIYTYANHPDKLRFTRNGETKTLDVKGLIEANDGQLLCAAAFEHMGILVQPRYILHDDIVAGRLVPVLDDWDLPRLTINLVFQSKRHLPAKVRCFIDFIAEHFRRMDYERKWTE